MYSLAMPVSQIRTKIRQEFERHRYVNSLPAVDVLLTQSHMEFQVREPRATVAVALVALQ
jgi:NADH dehydrogenase (ubiquinone) 1 alpha subcomplex subunit 6